MSFCRSALRTGAPCLVLASLVWAAACSSTYYGVMEQLGREKRHILRDRVEAGQEAQEQAQKQFQSTYDAFKSVTHYEGGGLEDFYGQMESDLEECEDRAEEVRSRIDSIERVSGDLFSEWSSEIDQISNTKLRRRSQQSLRESEARYDRMISAMLKAATEMDPVLVAFRDQVLYLKHNLNARAVAALQSNVREIEAEVKTLVRDMQAAVDQAQSFLETVPIS